jgi:hypothetical protein
VGPSSRAQALETGALYTHWAIEYNATVSSFINLPRFSTLNQSLRHKGRDYLPETEIKNTIRNTFIDSLDNKNTVKKRLNDGIYVHSTLS